MVVFRNCTLVLLLCFCSAAPVSAGLALGFSNPTISLNPGASSSALTMNISYTGSGDNAIAGYSLGFLTTGGTSGTLTIGSVAVPTDPIFSSYVGGGLVTNGDATAPLSDPFQISGTSNVGDVFLSGTRNAATFTLTASADASGTFSLFARKFDFSNYVSYAGDFSSTAFSNADADHLLLSTITVVPEPSTFILFGLAMAGGMVLPLRSWRKSREASATAKT